MLLRDAVSPLPDRTFARRVGITTAITTAMILGGMLYVLGKPRVDRQPTPRATIRIPSIEAARLPAEMHPAERALVKRELARYAFEAFPAWAASDPERECPRHLLELNRFDPTLHAVDPWGTPYQFVCGRQYQVGLSTRSAGPDRAFDTADDLSSTMP